MSRAGISSWHRLVAGVVAVIVADLLIIVASMAGSAVARRADVTAPRATTATSTQTPVASPSVPYVAPLAHRRRPDIVVWSNATLPPDELRTIRRLAHPVAFDVIDRGRIRIGRGHTTAVGINPSRFRAFTPRGTAGADALWMAVARGEVAIAHPVAAALKLPLGGMTRAGRGVRLDVRVGALAISGLPSIGVMASHDDAGRLGLTPRSAVVLSLRDELDAPQVRQLLQSRLGSVATVRTVQSFVPVQAAWVAPAAGQVTSAFGMRAYPLDPSRRDFHPGIDIAAPFGAPVWAAASGTVLYAGPAAGFGNEIILLHPGGVTTVYGHMSRLLVRSGAVRVGQPIAVVGSEGESTGPHLHFEVRQGDRRLDPIAWLRSHGVPLN